MHYVYTQTSSLIGGCIQGLTYEDIQWVNYGIY